MKILLTSIAVYALLVNAQPEKGLSWEPATSDSQGSTKRDTATSEVIRGVNIGGWLLLEPYMNSAIMSSAADQWTFDQTDGAEAILQEHWSSWFQESDVAQIAAWGLNTIRIPVGFWAYNNTGTPYIQGADAYLEKALGWCANHGLKALICLHGAPGSQNGFDNSGHSGSADWITSDDDNMMASISVLQTIATKYGSNAYSDVVWGLELINEPVMLDDDSFAHVESWVEAAYDLLINNVENTAVKIVMHDAFIGASNWVSIGEAINSDCGSDPRFYIDTHLYQNQDASDSLLTQAEHIEKVCNYASTEFLSASVNLPVVVGEFTDQINICVDANGTITPGTNCSTEGCQCSAALDTSEWNGYLINATRIFLETQMDVFEKYSSGWFMWTYNGPGAWGLTNLFDVGVIGPDTVTQREFSYQCS